MSNYIPTEEYFDHMMLEWRVCDFYKYNPEGSSESMDYPTYRRLRLAGKLPNPSDQEIKHDVQFPIEILLPSPLTIPTH